RDEFPHWSSHEDNCNTRELVLERDGDDVETTTDCYPTSGSWYSELDGETVSDPSDIDIDHVVPHANACRTGAPEGATGEREVDGGTVSRPSDIDIDHVVPPANAWRTSAAESTTDARGGYANGLGPPQLSAARAASNRSKGESDAYEWQPMDSYDGTDAAMWV